MTTFCRNIHIISRYSKDVLLCVVKYTYGRKRGEKRKEGRGVEM